MPYGMVSSGSIVITLSCYRVYSTTVRNALKVDSGVLLQVLQFYHGAAKQHSTFTASRHQTSAKTTTNCRRYSTRRCRQLEGSRDPRVLPAIEYKYRTIDSQDSSNSAGAVSSQHSRVTRMSLTCPQGNRACRTGRTSMLRGCQRLSNQIKFISKCKNSAHSKHVMHLGVQQGVQHLQLPSVTVSFINIKKANYQILFIVFQILGKIHIFNSTLEQVKVCY